MMATKPLHGHLLGAACAAETALVVRSMELGLVPPLHKGDRDPACGVVWAAEAPCHISIEKAVKVAVGFGGQVSVNVLGRGGR